MKFVADDGHVFNNYKDCVEYERTHGKIIECANLFYDHITMYDEDGNIIRPEEDISNIEAYWKEILYILDSAEVYYLNIQIENEEWQKVTNIIRKECGSSLPPSRGLWRYDYITNKWITFAEDLEIFLYNWAKNDLPNLQVTQK